MANNGSVFINKYYASYWAYDYESNFGGPYESLEAALKELELEYGEACGLEINTNLSVRKLQKLVKLEGTSGSVITINDEYWEFGPKNKLQPYEGGDEDSEDGKD